MESQNPLIHLSSQNTSSITTQQNVNFTTTPEDNLKYSVIDEKKKKKMISNRDSARRSRMRKQKRVEELTQERTTLQAENSFLKARIDGVAIGLAKIESKNNVMRAQALELTERLKSLNDVINSSIGLDLDDFLNPNLLPSSMQPIPATNPGFFP